MMVMLSLLSAIARVLCIAVGEKSGMTVGHSTDEDATADAGLGTV